MKTFVGTIIIITSVSIMILEVWYYHSFMIAFGRGLPEATYYQRLIASVITSIPFFIFIYLAFSYLIFESHNEKEPRVKGKWSLPEITGAFLGFAILWPLISGVIIGDLLPGNLITLTLDTSKTLMGNTSSITGVTSLVNS